MKALASALVAGFVFGIGLWVSGMANPKKVLGFLDVAGDWDASLMLVMGGAVVVSFLAFRFIPRRGRPIFETKFDIPDLKNIDLRLVAGAAIFGLGWGTAGYCPGPAITALSTLSTESIVFVAAMLVGGFLQRALSKR